jgi:hypothetical protein
MKPRIDGTEFGSITVEGETHHEDILIRLDGQVKKRKKKLSKAVYGTSHIVSLAEAEHIYEEGASGQDVPIRTDVPIRSDVPVRIIFGTGQSGLLGLSDEATAYFQQKGCQVELLPTGEAIQAWNQAEGAVVGVFHVTC